MLGAPYDSVFTSKISPAYKDGTFLMEPETRTGVQHNFMFSSISNFPLFSLCKEVDY